MEAHRYKSLGFGKLEKKEVVKQEVTPVVHETRVCNQWAIKCHILKDYYKRKIGVQMAAAMKFQGDKSAEKSENKTWRKTVNTESAYSKHQTDAVGPRCRQHKKENCAECTIIIHEGEDHGCGAVLSDIFELRCGCQVPIVADACQVEHKNNMPECEGWINGEKEGESVTRHRVLYRSCEAINGGR